VKLLEICSILPQSYAYNETYRYYSTFKSIYSEKYDLFNIFIVTFIYTYNITDKYYIIIVDNSYVYFFKL